MPATLTPASPGSARVALARLEAQAASQVDRHSAAHDPVDPGGRVDPVDRGVRAEIRQHVRTNRAAVVRVVVVVAAPRTATEFRFERGL